MEWGTEDQSALTEQLLAGADDDDCVPSGAPAAAPAAQRSRNLLPSIPSSREIAIPRPPSMEAYGAARSGDDFFGSAEQSRTAGAASPPHVPPARVPCLLPLDKSSSNVSNPRA